MFNTAIDQLKAVRGNTEVIIVKLGTVTGLSNGRAQVKLYGDGSTSTKLYQYIDGYIPEVNDKVALLPQGKTYIILGKISDVKPVEKYATKEYVDDTFLPLEYKNKLEDNGNTLTLTESNLLPGSNNSMKLGASDKQFSSIYGQYFYDNGERLRADGIVITYNGTAYNLLAIASTVDVTLTPSVDDKWNLGSSSRKFKSAYLGLFRGSWKSGQSTERQISWNSSNAIVPDAANTVDFGTGSLPFKNIFCGRILAAVAPNLTSPYLSWQTTSAFGPSQNNAVDLGTSSKQFSKIYANEFYINGTKLDISGIEVSKLTAKSGGYTRTLTMTASSSGATILPSVNNAFTLGSATAMFSEIFAAKFTGDLNGKILDGSYNLAWDASHNLIPSTTNYLSLGTSSKQYKNVYGQNLYVNGTAVTSDKNLKEDIKELEEKHLAFFRCLRPVQFKYKDGESGRTHTGFIAQEVEDAIHEAGMTNQDMAVVVIDQESGRHYLRYEEIIAVQTQVIQNMQKKVDSLEARLAKLEALLERSTK